MSLRGLTASDRQKNFAKALAWHAGFFAAFLALSRLASVFQSTELRATPWNPETGLAVAAGLMLGAPACVTMALAIFVSTRLWGWALPGFWEYASAVLRALVFTGSAAAAARFLLKYPLPRLQTMLIFFGFAALVTLIYAVVRIATLTASVGIEPRYFIPFTLTLSIGNLVGILTVVPLFMLKEPPARLIDYIRTWSVFQWSALAGLAVMSFIVFGIREVDEFKFFYLVFLPVIAFAVKDGLAAAAFSVFASDLLMIVVLYLRDFESSTAMELQFLMLSLSVTGLLLGTAISDRKRAVLELEESHIRLQESQSALLQASRISLASEMAAALAHELNQPLSAVRNFARAARRRLDAEQIDRTALAADVNAAVAQVDTAATLLRSTRNFLERGSARRQSQKLEDVVVRCISLVRPELQRARISITHSGMEGLPPVICNEIQIQQVILNLVRNAREAIAAAEQSTGEIVINASAATRPGFVEVSVADNGPGVPPDLRPQLFLPLQSTKPEGLGLGLSLCSSIIRSHGGEFWLDENPRHGARFVFTLPCDTERDATWTRPAS